MADTTSKAKTAGRKAGGAVSRRLDPYLPPWGVGALAMPTAVITHAAWGDRPGMTAAMGAASLLITGWSYRTWARRSGDSQNLAAVFAGAETGWITIATVADPTSNNMLSAWALGVPTLAVMWNLRTGAAADDNDKTTDSNDTLWDRVKRLKGARTKRIDERNGQLDVTVQLQGGEQTVADVQASLPHIASALAIDETAVQAVPVDGRADQAKLSIRPQSPLAGPVLYPGPSHLGQSIAAGPLRFGVRADGEPLIIFVVGDPEVGRPLPHTLATGMTGSGKTETICWLIVELRTRTDAVPVVGDPAKFRQSFGDIADAIEVIADGAEPTRRLIDNLPRAIEYRAALLGSLGYKEWVPECYTKHGIPLVWVDIEEAADVVAGNERMVEALRKARSVGISLTASLQVAGYTDIPRKARGQFGNALAHGVSEDQDARFALADHTLAAGADPTQWGNEQPGSQYVEAVGVPRVEWSIEGRSYRPDYAARRAILDATRPHWARLDEGTRKILAAGISEPDTAVALADTDADEPDKPRGTDEVAAEFGPIDLDQPIPRQHAGAAVQFGARPAEQRMTPEAARTVFDQRIDDLEADGQTEVTAADFADVRKATGRTSRGWVYEQLERCAREGRLEAGAGKTYRIRARVGV